MLSSDGDARLGDDVGEVSTEGKVTASEQSKYMSAGKALNNTIGVVMAACIPGARIFDICQLGDLMITQNLEDVFMKSYKDKALAFPTCVSVNSEVCHACPLESDDTELKEKDLIRIEMACHVDGCIASLVQTLFVTTTPLTDSVTGRAADVICAVNQAAEIVLDVVGPGTKMQSFNEILKEVASCFRCKVLEISGCYQLKEYEVKDSSCSIPTPDEDEFLKDRAYMVDIAFASDAGELEVSDESQATVYRSTVDEDFDVPEETLPIFNEIKQKFPKMPFCVKSLENFTWGRISACTKHDILQPYHILHMRSGLVAQTRFLLVVRQIRKFRFTEAPKQVLKPMVPVEILGGIHTLWAKMSRKNKGQGQHRMKLSYCGRLPIGEESCGVKPYISDVSWSITEQWKGASEALACTGSFGTYVYLRLDSMIVQRNIEDGWEKVVIQDTPGQFCQWSPDGTYLAVGTVRNHDNVPEVHIFYWDDKAFTFQGRRVYEGNEANCQFLNPLSWSHDSKFLLAPSYRTHHVPVLKVEKKKTYCWPVRFSENNAKYDNLCAAFHPRILLFIAASSTGHLKLYETDQSKMGNKAQIWNEDGKEWDDDDKCGILELSFCTKDVDKLACARSNGTVKIWSFDYDAAKHKTFLSPLFIINPSGHGNLSIKWKPKENDFLAVGDGRQIISIYGSKYLQKFCGNELSADVSARFTEATRIAWRHKHLAFASGGQDGFILFWCLHSHPSEVIWAPKQRNIHVENMYYTKRPLKHDAASTASQEFEKSRAIIRQEFEKTQKLLKNAVDESGVKHDQLNQIALLANTGLTKINAGEASVDELADYFKEILQLSTKQTL